MSDAIGWIGVDFDGTVATYEKWVGPAHCGEPIAPMIDRIKKWLSEGREVRIFTARAFPLGLSFMNGIKPNDIVPMQHGIRGQECETAVQAIRDWCARHVGQALTITCIKDQKMATLYDDRCVQVQINTGRIISD